MLNKIRTILLIFMLVSLLAYSYPITILAANITWNTFLGGSGGDGVDDVTMDTNSNIYITAYCDSDWGTRIRPYSAGADLSVSKLDPSGTASWHTFLGGTGTDYSTGITYSEFDNHIYIAGMSDASWGTPLQAHGGNSKFDGFIAKLDLNGNLIWHTFVGGGGRDRGRGLDINPSNGDVYITGDSDSTWGTPVQAFTSGINIFIARLNNSGTLIWSTFTAGNGLDNGVGGISLDGAANSHIVGSSNGTWGTPVRPYAGGNTYDVYAAKIDSSGLDVWNTFLGAPGPAAGNEYGGTVKIDTSNNVYALSGSGISWGTPLTAHQGGRDGFIAKLNSSGALQWHTFIGGTGDDETDRMRIPGDGYIYIDGKSTATWGSPDRNYSAGQDAYLLKLSTAGAYQWHMFLGGTGNDFCTGVVLDGLGHIVVTGASNATWGSPLNPYTLGTDSFIVKINEAFISPTITETATATPSITPSVTPTTVTGQTATATASPTSPAQTLTMTISPTLTATPALEQSLISNFIIFPNPVKIFEQEATLQYILTEDAKVTITIYTYLGSRIKTTTLSPGQIGAQGHPGGHINQLNWDGRNQQGLLQATGGYICKIIAEGKHRKEETILKVSLIR